MEYLMLLGEIRAAAGITIRGEDAKLLPTPRMCQPRPGLNP
jgi:hypothetical protein